MIDNETINKAIAEFMNLCWHEFEPYRAIHGNDKCLKNCGATRYDDNLHRDFCSPDSPRRLLQEVIANVIVTPKGWNNLHRNIDLQLGTNQQIIEATAEQIARAVYDVITEAL